MDVDTSKSGWINWTRDFKKKKLTETLELTYNMLKEGKTIKKIAKERGFKEESVERHVVELITKSFLIGREIIGEKKYLEISQAVEELGVESLSELKEKLGDKYSYFDIKCFLAELGAEPESIKK